MTDRSPVMTGGCQCGAVRYALFARPKASFCHCRMCQKAVGGPFAALAKIDKADLAWTRGQPAAYRSSSAAFRDFCAACGTPLTFRFIDAAHMEVTTGSLDRPQDAVPEANFGVESRMPWLAFAVDGTARAHHGRERETGTSGHGVPAPRSRYTRRLGTTPIVEGVFSVGGADGAQGAVHDRTQGRDEGGRRAARLYAAHDHGQAEGYRHRRPSEGHRRRPGRGGAGDAARHGEIAPRVGGALCPGQPAGTGGEGNRRDRGDRGLPAAADG